MPKEGKLILTANQPQWRAAPRARLLETAAKPVLHLGELTSRHLMLAGLRNRDGMEVLRNLCDALAREQLVTHASDFFSTAMNREITGNTTVPPEWAIPHVRSSRCARLCLAVATCPSGVNWFGTAGVRAVFLFGVPECEAMTYMFAISALARVTQNHAQVAEIGQAEDPQTLLKLLSAIPLKAPVPGPGPIVN